MGQQIIKQPDGYYAVFSSNTDTILVYDATVEEIEEWYVEREVRQFRQRVRDTLRHVAANEPRKAYHQFAMTWEQALRKDREHGGRVWKDYQPVAKEQP